MITATLKLTDTDIATIRKNLEHHVEAMKNRDFDEIMSLYTDDVLFMPPDEPVIEGKEAARRWVEGFPEILDFDAELVEAEGAEDLACVHGTFSMKIEEEGTPVTRTGKWLASYRRQPGDDWLCAWDAWNLDA
jgi:ketosteroid isomerase-like protein